MFFFVDFYSEFFYKFLGRQRATKLISCILLYNIYLIDYMITIVPGDRVTTYVTWSLLLIMRSCAIKFECFNACTQPCSPSLFMDNLSWIEMRI